MIENFSHTRSQTVTAQPLRIGTELNSDDSESPMFGGDSLRSPSEHTQQDLCGKSRPA